jgi:hypothetical protein
VFIEGLAFCKALLSAALSWVKKNYTGAIFVLFLGPLRWGKQLAANVGNRKHTVGFANRYMVSGVKYFVS